MLELVVLSTLMFGPCHGYVFKAYKGMHINNNTIYPLLKKLTNQGYIKAELVVQEGKPAKKVYELTEAGKDRLIEMLKDFDSTKALSDDEFYLRIAYFQFLDKKSIAKIINAREEALNKIETVSVFENVLDNFPDTTYDLLFLKNFIKSQHTQEKKFLMNLRKKYNVK